MKRRIKALALCVFTVFALTGCTRNLPDLLNKAIERKEERASKGLDKAILTKIFAKESIDPVYNSENLTYSLTYYEFFENNDEYIIDVYGKLQGTNYNSCVKVRFDKVDKSKIDVTNTNDLYYYQTLTKIVKSNENYNVFNTRISNFNDIDSILNDMVLKELYDGFGLKNIETIRLENFSYDSSSKKISFNTSCVAAYDRYITHTETDSNGVATETTFYFLIYFKYDFLLTCDIPTEDYVLNQESTGYFVDLFSNYFKNNENDKFTIKTLDSTKLQTKQRSGHVQKLDS